MAARGEARHDATIARGGAKTLGTPWLAGAGCGFQEPEHGHGAVAGQIEIVGDLGAVALLRLRIAPGGRIRYGDATFRISDIISDVPDRVGEGFTLGPVAIVSMEGLRRTGLIQPGSLYESKYRIRLAGGGDAGKAREALEKRLASAGWELKDRDRAAPGANRFFERMGQFLSLIGLAALAIAGIGVSNGVSSYMALKRGSIATLRVLGATSRDIERIYLLQIGAVTAMTPGYAAG